MCVCDTSRVSRDAVSVIFMELMGGGWPTQEKCRQKEKRNGHVLCRQGDFNEANLLTLLTDLQVQAQRIGT